MWQDPYSLGLMSHPYEINGQNTANFWKLLQLRDHGHLPAKLDCHIDIHPTIEICVRIYVCVKATCVSVWVRINMHVRIYRCQNWNMPTCGRINVSNQSWHACQNQHICQDWHVSEWTHVTTDVFQNWCVLVSTCVRMNTCQWTCLNQHVSELAHMSESMCMWKSSIWQIKIDVSFGMCVRIDILLQWTCVVKLTCFIINIHFGIDICIISDKCQ